LSSKRHNGNYSLKSHSKSAEYYIEEAADKLKISDSSPLQMASTAFLSKPPTPPPPAGFSFGVFGPRVMDLVGTVGMNNPARGKSDPSRVSLRSELTFYSTPAQQFDHQHQFEVI